MLLIILAKALSESRIVELLAPLFPFLLLLRTIFNEPDGPTVTPTAFELPRRWVYNARKCVYEGKEVEEGERWREVGEVKRIEVVEQASGTINK